MVVNTMDYSQTGSLRTESLARVALFLAQEPALVPERLDRDSVTAAP